MSCDNSDESCCRGSHVLFWITLLLAGAFVVASLPEIKRYVRITTM
jgi:hypothetical protein